MIPSPIWFTIPNDCQLWSMYEPGYPSEISLQNEPTLIIISDLIWNWFHNYQKVRDNYNVQADNSFKRTETAKMTLLSYWCDRQAAKLKQRRLQSHETVGDTTFESLNRPQCEHSAVNQRMFGLQSRYTCLNATSRVLVWFWSDWNVVDYSWSNVQPVQLAVKQPKSLWAHVQQTPKSVN